MKSFKKSVFSVQAASIAIALSGLTAPSAVYAQEAPADDAAECTDADANGVCDSEEKGQIVVTGSRIARPTLESPIPLTSVSIEELTDTGKVSLGDALNDLPSLRSTFSSGSTARNIFSISGLALLDLRGLGTDRTLVLINGRRHVTSSPGDNAFDVNTIPVDLVQRVDVVTGGNSAVYGSDAVAGVVNFVMKKNYDGFAIRGQSGISSRGDRGTSFVSAVYGKNFGDGRGNIAVSAEYTRQEPLYFAQRNELTGAQTGRCQFQLTDVTAGEPAAGDGIPDTTFMCGVKSAAISDAGTIFAIDPASSAIRRYLRFDDLGNVFVDTPTQSFSNVASGNQLGGFGSTLNNTGQLLAAVDRYAFNVLAHYDVSDAFTPFIEAKYVRTDTFGEGQPSFWQGSIPAFFGGGANLRCDNPFLTAQALGQLQAFGRCPAGPPSATPFAISRFNVDFGGRIGESVRETYRVVAGVGGSFNDDWNYEVAFNYGKYRGRTKSRNNLYLFDELGNPDGFLLAIDSTLAPAGFAGTNFATNAAGQRVVCRINAVTNVRPDCLPINVFGQNKNSPEALAFIHRDGEINDDSSQFVASAYINGDLSQLFELPGGPISFAIGGEYREEKDLQTIDEISKDGRTFLNALSDFTPPKLVVKEIYGELLIPLAKDITGLHDLSVTVAGRMSDYNNSTGTVYAYNIQGVWAPISDIRFRAAYATSVRAPTQSDLYTGAFQNFAAITDPCDQGFIGNGPNRAANCAAGAVPTTANAAAVAACAASSFTLTLGGPWGNCLARSVTQPFSQGGNPTLIAERGKSLTLGAVLEPRFLPGLNLTVDFYDIKVKNLIAVLGAQAILNLCYDSPTSGAPACATVNRNPATGLFNDPLVVAGGINFAAQHTRGLDFDLSYRRTFDNGHKLSVRGIATRVMKLDNFTDPTNAINPNRQLGELGDPLWAANFQMSYDFGKVALLYNARYIGKMTTAAAWETQNPYFGACPASGVTPNTGGINGAAVPCTTGTVVAIAPNNADANPVAFFPAVIYHDVRLDFEMNDKFNFYGGINNLGDKRPPFGELGNVAGSPYDSFGRYFFVGVQAKF